MSSGGRLATRIWHAGVAVIVLFALILQFVLTVTGGVDANNGEAGSGVPLGERIVRSYSFFTVDSNILVLVIAIMIVMKPVSIGTVRRVLHLTSLVSIIITGVVFSFVLAPGLQLTPAAEVVTVCFHYLTPWLFVLSWLIFGPRPQWGWRILPLVFVWPIVWLGYTVIRGAVTGWYPYPFLDAGVIGIGRMLINAAIVAVVALVIAVLVLLIDRFIPSLGHPRAAIDRSSP